MSQWNVPKIILGKFGKLFLSSKGSLIVQNHVCRLTLLSHKSN